MNQHPSDQRDRKSTLRLSVLAASASETPEPKLAPPLKIPPSPAVAQSDARLVVESRKSSQLSTLKAQESIAPDVIEPLQTIRNLPIAEEIEKKRINIILRKRNSVPDSTHTSIENYSDYQISRMNLQQTLDTNVKGILSSFKSISKMSERPMSKGKYHSANAQEEYKPVTVMQVAQPTVMS